MVVVEFEAARRRRRLAFARVVLIASVAVFTTTVAVGTYWDHIATSTMKAIDVVQTAASEFALPETTDASDVSPVMDTAQVGAIPDEAFLAPEGKSRKQTRGWWVNQSFSLCRGSKRFTCVVDGDTFWLNGEKIRIADIDTPEIGNPKCARELALGNKAKRRLQSLLAAGPFEMHALPDRDTDRYGRSLRILVRNGQSIGGRLVSEGLARTWSGRREPWCKT